MKNDLLKQYVSLRDSLAKEKSELESRLAEINRALGSDVSAPKGLYGGPQEEILVARQSTVQPRVGRPRKYGSLYGGNTQSSLAPAQVPGARGRKPRKRAQNVKSLRETVVEVVGNKSLNRQEILEAVLKSGYVFSAKDPLNSLSTLLYTDKKTFRNKDGRFSVA